MALSGRDKAAVVVLSLEQVQAAELFRHLDERAVVALTEAVASPPKVTAKEQAEVLAEFDSLLSAQGYLRQGGVQKAREILEVAYGREQADVILRRLGSTLRSKPFEALRTVSPDDLITYLESEHPQTAALVLAYVPPPVGAKVLEAMPQPRRVEVIERLARLEIVRPEVLRAVEESVSDRVSAWIQFDIPGPKGLDAAVGILVRAGRHLEKEILTGLSEHDKALAEEIESRMFTFDDLLRLRLDVLQKVLREVDRTDLAKALRPYPEDVRQTFYNALSERAAAELKEEIEDSAPIPVREVEAAQGRLVAKVRELDEQGEIDLAEATQQVTMV